MHRGFLFLHKFPSSKLVCQQNSSSASPEPTPTLELGSFKLSPAANDTNGDEDTPKALLTNVFLKNQGARTLSTLNKVPERQHERKKLK